MNRLFSETVSRNFSESFYDPRMLMYKFNVEDEQFFPNTPTFSEKKSALKISKQDSQQSLLPTSQSEMALDLQGGPDAYSDAESDKSKRVSEPDSPELEKPERASRLITYKQVYQFC